MPEFNLNGALSAPIWPHDVKGSDELEVIVDSDRELLLRIDPKPVRPCEFVRGHKMFLVKRASLLTTLILWLKQKLALFILWGRFFLGRPKVQFRIFRVRSEV